MILFVADVFEAFGKLSTGNLKLNTQALNVTIKCKSRTSLLPSVSYTLWENMFTFS